MSLEAEEFCKWLAEQENLNTNNIFEILDDEERRKEIERFFKQESKIDDLYESFDNIRGTELEIKFIENLLNLYPLSKKVIKKFNKNQVKIEKKSIPSLFQSSNYLDSFFNVLFKETQFLKEEGKSNEAISRLEDKLENLDQEIGKFKETIKYLKSLDNSENNEKKQERDQLELELEKLKKDSDLEKIEEDIINLTQEKDDLYEKYSKKLERKKELRKEIEKIDISKNELKELEAIKVLKEIWPKDEA